MPTQEELAMALRQQPAAPPPPPPQPRIMQSQPAPQAPAPASFGNVSGPITPQRMEVQALRAMPSMQQPAPGGGGPTLPKPSYEGPTGGAPAMPPTGDGASPYRVPRAPIPPPQGAGGGAAGGGKKEKKKKGRGSGHYRLSGGAGQPIYYGKDPGMQYEHIPANKVGTGMYAIGD